MSNVTLPKLTGSEKQIAWAEQIRTRIMSEIETQLANSPEITDANRAQAERVLAVIEYTKSQASADWWIKNIRDYSFRGCAKLIADQAGI